MNTTLKTKLAILVALAFVATASAFYNAETGRWLSRDPIGESGFTLRASVRQPSIAADVDVDSASRSRPEHAMPTELNLHGFVLNNPQNFVDLLGLISFDGCDAGQRAELTAAWNSACAKIKDPKFRCCVNDSRLLQMYERRCNWGNVQFKCRENNEGLCPWVCAHAWQSLGIGRGVIVVCRQQFDNPFECPLNLKCTLMHEMTHVLGGTPFEGGIVERAEKCCSSQ